MSRGINKVLIMGNLGADPEVRYMPSGGAVTNLRVATSESWKDRQTGEKQERTEWHRIVLFNRLGEIAAQYLRKGSRVFIEGAIRTNKWKDQAGVERETKEIVASSMQLMDSKGSGGAAPFEQSGEMPQDRMENASQNYSTAAPTRTPEMATAGAEEDFDDGIPF